ncbi:hypothetical protein AB205_0017450 [Aquarana catesbeiana]|uniref:Sperm-specific antigen 2 C-terminal domain-containing protein n=1 Tax=Aquarana catesbeiana TaxID=8400 RepID=A0A2G9SCD5_AQUCT|nr:hypothetical protein AB205_0017450 [Aquarana catesbeiana]
MLRRNLHGSSESLDSQVTLHGKSSSSEFPDISEEYDDVQDFTDPLVTENATVTSASHSLPTGKHMYKSLSMTTENSDDFFQSFESHADNMKEMYKQISILEDTENELEEITNGVSYFQDGEQEYQMDNRQTQTPVSSEMEYPVYVTHYLSDIRKTNSEFSSETSDDQDCFGGHVSHPQVKSDSESNSFADDECSVVSSSVKWTSSPMNSSQNFSFHAQTPTESVDYSDHELHYCHQDKKSTFQTELNTNIYKSVTIQMSSNFLQDPGESASRQHSVYSTSNNRNESRDDDMDNMKKACQTYREKLLTIEQHLLEQQAGCFNVLTSEEREKIRRLHLLRRDVLKEATELEFNLDERARHVKEAISVQLEQVLEEQSRLYSELEFSDLELERSAEGHSKNLYKSQSVPSTSDLSDPEEDPEIKTNSEAGIQSQKIDFSTILENIKKTFRSFNN